MHRLWHAVLLLVILGCDGSTAQTNSSLPGIVHRDFKLSLSNNWAELQTNEEYLWNFISKEPAATLVFSARPVSVSEDGLATYAGGIIRARKQLEREARAGRSSIKFLNDSVEMTENGKVVKLSYVGRDEARNEYVHFIGYLTQFRLYSFWTATESLIEEDGAKVMTGVISGFSRNAP
jgi:hypothetical protein